MAQQVTFQVNLAPADFPHARHTLPHQLRQWAGQVDEFLLTTDLHRVRRGHFGEGWDERRAPLAALIAECAAKYPNIRALDVDYDAAASRRVSAAEAPHELVRQADPATPVAAAGSACRWS